MVTLTLLDIDEAEPALEKLVATRLGPKALLRVTRYSKWAFTQRPAIRAAKEALARELGEPSADSHGSWHIPAGRPKQEYNRRLRDALLEPATVPADLQPISSADLLAAASCTPFELASIWFMIADWNGEPTVEPGEPTAAEPGATPRVEINNAMVASGSAALGEIAQSADFDPPVALHIARWLRSLAPALRLTQTLMFDAGLLYGERDGNSFTVPAEKVTDYRAMIEKGLAETAVLRPPFPAPVPAVAFENANLAPRDLLSIDWMLDWNTPEPAPPESKREPPEASSPPPESPE